MADDKTARNLVFKKAPDAVEDEGKGSYIRLTGDRLTRFDRIRVALGHEGNRGVKETGDQVADFGMDAIEEALKAAGAPGFKPES